MAPALVVSDYDAWHFASAYRTTSLIGSSAAQVKPVHLLSTPPHKSKSLMHIHAAPDSMKAMTASDGRVTDGCYIADPATAVAIWVPPVPLCGVSTLTTQSSTALVTWSPLMALPGINTSTAKAFTALVAWTPLQTLSAAGLCPAQEVPTALISTDYTMTMEPTLAWLRHAVKWLSLASRKCQYGVKALIDAHTCINVPSDFVVSQSALFRISNAMPSVPALL